MFIVVFSFILVIGLFIGLGLETSPVTITKTRFNKQTQEVETIEARHKNKKALQWKLTKLQLLAPLGFFVVVLGMFTTVNANEVGIVYDPLRGGLQAESFDEGLHVKAPWIKVTKISTKLREAQFEMSAQTGIILNMQGEPTGGGQWVTYEVAFQYRVGIQNAHTFYRTFGGNDVDPAILEAIIKKSLQENSTEYSVFAILRGSIVNVTNNTQEELIGPMSQLGITVQTFVIRDVDAGLSIEQVVEAEAIAAKQEEIAIKEQAAAIVREETKKLEAEIAALTVVIKATADAEAEALLKSVTINAINVMYQGQFSDAAEQLAFEASLAAGTPEGGFLSIQEVSTVVLTQLYYDTWDGILPTVLAGDGTGLIIQP
ncbi:MAG: SPFH domain-containing protein [Acholeplasmataceae bacterium]